MTRLTLEGDGGTVVSNLGDGVAQTDAVNVRQLDSARAQAVDLARAYADTRMQALEAQWSDFQDDVWQRMGQTEQRIDRQGAMNAAMMQMGMNAGGSRSPRGRVAVGVGMQSGQKAMAVGYAKPVGERASFSLGASFSGNEKSAGVGFGLDL
jgi:hypothetical protein